MLREILRLVPLVYLLCFGAYGQQQNVGNEVQDALNQSYANISTDCGSSSRPAFLCSGVLIRGTDAYSSSFHSWDPSPSSQTSGGVSFSYLRKDSKFSKLAYGYNNGFIFYPYFNAPEGKDTNIDIMCSFPIDAASENRGDKGCGSSAAYPQASGNCQAQGIYTAAQWYEHYQQGNNDHQYQCSFETSDNSVYNTADGFYQTLLSMALIGAPSFNEQNELRLATWAQGMQNTLPMEAFFYISGTSGLSSAQSNQQDFYNNTSGHILIPVIEMKMPASQSEDVQFIYNESDQTIIHH